MSYESTINNILRDKAHAWSLNYYNEKATSYDVSLARAQAMLELMKKEGELHAAQKTHASFLALSKNPSPKLKGDIKNIESVIGQLKSDVARLCFTSHGATRPYSLSGAQDIIDTIAYSQFLEKQRFSSLQGVRNHFMVTGDEEAMREGVVTTEDRFSTAMASLGTVLPSKVPLEVEPSVPLESHKKRNRRYEEEDDGWVDPEQVKGWRNKDW